MANITLSNNAQMNLEMEAMTVETAGHCDEWNTRHKQLLENDKYLNDQIENKAEKVDGKGLSTNDYTNEDKNKLAGIATGANKTIVDSALSSSSINPVQNAAVTAAITALGAPVLIQDTEPSDKTALWVK